MKMPLTITNGDNQETFTSVEDAEAYMSPNGVDSGSYAIKDAAGRQVSVHVVIERIPFLFKALSLPIRKVKIIGVEEY